MESAARPARRRASLAGIVIGIDDIAEPPSESARTVVRLATIGPGGPTGTLQDKDGELAW